MKLSISIACPQQKNSQSKVTYRNHVFGGLELPEGDIDGDTTLTLGLELVQDPSILEGALAQLGGFLLLESASESMYKVT